MRWLLFVVGLTGCSIGMNDLSGESARRPPEPSGAETSASAPQAPPTTTTPEEPSTTEIAPPRTTVVKTLFNATAFHHAQVVDEAEAGDGYVLEEPTFRVLVDPPPEPHATLYRCKNKSTSQTKGRFLTTDENCEDAALYEREATLGFVLLRSVDAPRYGAQPLHRCYRSKPFVMDHESRLSFPPAECAGELGEVQGFALP
jgi:hypothetical protein